MKNFRRLCFAIVLAAMFTVPALAGQLETPPCTNPGQIETPPGETQTPPCAANRDTEEPSRAGITQAPGYAETVQLETPAFETVLFLIQTVF